jgi:hypothetical protein
VRFRDSEGVLEKMKIIGGQMMLWKTTIVSDHYIFMFMEPFLYHMNGLR